ncbi:MAG: methionine sulfoxide reductase heme-binding subunit [Solirubrobacteraceae bacterium]|nr:methionine sulfoxide reductase heme-binding subunit [Solirubrobacteraceae bacterium]
MTGRDPLEHAWWLAGRSAGVVAYLLLSASVLLGLAMALRLAPPRHAAVLRTAHERVALIALGAVGAHGLFLLGDGWLHPGIVGILVPFQMAYRPVWTGLGLLAGYLAAALSLTYYARARIGPRRWRTAHRLIPVAWAMAAAHVIGAGSDAGSLWLQVPLALTISAVLALLGQRLLGESAAKPSRTRRQPSAATPEPTPRREVRPQPTPPLARSEPSGQPEPGYRPLWARQGVPRER